MTKHLRTLWSGRKAWQAIGRTLAAGFALLPGTLCAQNGRFTCATMNVDGLPPSITVDYIVGSTTIEINPDGKAGTGATAIARKVLEQNWDFLAVNEDFNFHTELMAPLAHSVRDVQLRRARPQDVTAEAQRVLGKQTGF